MSVARLTLIFALTLTLSLSTLAAAADQRGAGVSASPAGESWAQLAKLMSSSASFGASVAISGNSIVVGAAPYGQTASVFVEPTGGWANMSQTATLAPSDGTTCSRFGAAVSISGNTIAVGDPEDSCGIPQPGSVYVFVEPPGGWSGRLTETAKLTASDAVGGDAVGAAVSIDGNTVVAGAAGTYPFTTGGAAYVFVEPASGWVNATQTAKLTEAGGQTGNELGFSVSVSGNTVAAGAPGVPVGANQAQGAAYVYVEPAGGWTNETQTAKLTASDGQQNDDLGFSVSISGQVVAAGAIGSNQIQGAAYVFAAAPGGWVSTTQVAKLTAAGGNAEDQLGTSVATDGNVVVSGAPWYSHSSNDLTSPFFHEGAAYIFVKPTNGWTSETQAATLTGSDARFGAYLGTSAAISGKTVVSGALFNNRNFGAGYVFSTLSGQ